MGVQGLEDDEDCGEGEVEVGGSEPRVAQDGAPQDFLSDAGSEEIESQKWMEEQRGWHLRFGVGAASGTPSEAVRPEAEPLS